MLPVVAHVVDVVQSSDTAPDDTAERGAAGAVNLVPPAGIVGIMHPIDRVGDDEHPEVIIRPANDPRIDTAIAREIVLVVKPQHQVRAIEAALGAERMYVENQGERQRMVEARYEASPAERRWLPVIPDNRRSLYAELLRAAAVCARVVWESHSLRGVSEIPHRAIGREKFFREPQNDRQIGRRVFLISHNIQGYQEF